MKTWWLTKPRSNIICIRKIKWQIGICSVLAVQNLQQQLFTDSKTVTVWWSFIALYILLDASFKSVTQQIPLEVILRKEPKQCTWISDGHRQKENEAWWLTENPDTNDIKLHNIYSYTRQINVDVALKVVFESFHLYCHHFINHAA